MRRTLVVLLWVVATTGVIYVANAAVELVDLQVFPEGSRIEVLSLSKNEETVSLATTSTSLPVPMTTEVLSEGSPIEKVAKESTKEAINEDMEAFNDENEAELPIEIVATTVIESEVNSTSTTILNAETAQIPEGEVIEADVSAEEELTGEMQETFELPAITSTTVLPATTTTVLIEPLTIFTSKLVKAQLGQSYSLQLNGSGGIAPYSWAIESGLWPDGLNLSESGLITGVLVSSIETNITFSLSDSTGKKVISDELIFETSPERRSVKARGGTAFIDIGQDLVSLFLASPADGYSAVIVEPGGFRVEVQFVPIQGEDTSFVICEVNEGVTCRSG